MTTSGQELQELQELMTLMEASSAEIATAATAIVGVTVVIAILAILFQVILFGVLTFKLAHRKGYKGYFWTGALLGLLGLIYVVGLPDNRRRRHKSSEEE